MEIDRRAYQLAYFALMMKARQYNRRILTEGVKPQVYEPTGYADGMEYGSLLQIDELESMPEQPQEITLFTEKYETQLNTWNFRRLLAQKYDVVVTNPPYMGSKGMSGVLSDWLYINYTVGKGDLSTAFMLRTMKFCNDNGIISMINIPVWMSKISYEGLRHEFLTQFTFCNMLHFGRGIFGSDFGTVAFTVYKNHFPEFIGVYHQLFDQLGAVDNIDIKEKWFLERKNLFQIKQDYFRNISSFPIAYWENQKFLAILQSEKPLSDYADARKGLTTGDNPTFIRLWHEIQKSKFTVFNPNTKWYPMTKGGDFRRWYGNNEYVVNWENNGFDIKNFKDKNGKLRSVPRNTKYYLQECISWNDTTASGKIAFRYQRAGYIPNASGPCVYCTDGKLTYYFGLLNSCVSQRMLFVLAPNMKFEVGQMALVPIIASKQIEYEEPVRLCVEAAKNDWDAFETSWDFVRHPLLLHGVYKQGYFLEAAFIEWECDAQKRFDTLKANEEELNRIFIDIYGFQDELTPEVEDKNVTIRKSDLVRDVKSFISYAIGCMFGRYSLDVDGLAFAGGDWDNNKYKTFIPDKDNVLPICDDEYFDDDIVGRFVDFVRVVYGGATLEENLAFIAKALGKNGVPREVIRNYFLNDFYKDHVKIYQKRPIYWMFDSGKKNGFKALIYLHRYKSDMLAQLRTDYVHEQQERYRTQLSHIVEAMKTATSADHVRLTKQQQKLTDQLGELTKFEEKIHHLADMKIEIDLDDGVRKNYELLADVLAKI